MKFFIYNIKIEKDIPYPMVITTTSIQHPAIKPEIIEDLEFILPFPTFTGSLERHHLIDLIFRMEPGDSFLAPLSYDQRVQTAFSYHSDNRCGHAKDGIYDLTGRVFKNKSVVSEHGYMRRWWRLL